MMNVIRKIHSTDIFLERHRFANARILNVGSSNTSFGHNCINVDIQNKVGIDCRCDAHRLAFRDSTFDIVLITAVLQYCVDPPRVVLELSRVLKPNGLLYVDAPLVQPYCPDTPDLFRFTKHGLIKLFQNEFIIEECDTSIPAGSALAFYIQALVATTSLGNRYINYVFVFFISLLIFPLSIVNFNKNHHVAGALYLVGRNSKNIDRKHRDITI